MDSPTDGPASGPRLRSRSGPPVLKSLTRDICCLESSPFPSSTLSKFLLGVLKSPKVWGFSRPAYEEGDVPWGFNRGRQTQNGEVETEGKGEQNEPEWHRRRGRKTRYGGRSVTEREEIINTRIGLRQKNSPSQNKTKTKNSIPE